MSLPGFEWNDEKALANLRKHGVSFIEAATVFDDPNCLIMDDDHSIGEVRFLILGYSKAYRLLLVVHCDRKNNIRLISARPATASERRAYQEGL